jgi:phosphoesterase RecJ-like protein
MRSDPQSNPQPHSMIDAVLSSIAKADRLLVTAHARPDGDAVGSLLACWMMLQRMGKQADMALSDRVPVIYRSLPCAALVKHWSQVEGDYDTVILLECDGIPRSRLEGLENRFLINIDHHTSGRPFANVNWIDSSACAVAEMVYQLAGAAGIGITPEMATCLYAAVLSDTGSFCYEGTDAHTFLPRMFISLTHLPKCFCWVPRWPTCTTMAAWRGFGYLKMIWIAPMPSKKTAKVS